MVFTALTRGNRQMRYFRTHGLFTARRTRAEFADLEKMRKVVAASLPRATPRNGPKIHHRRLVPYHPWD
jgi:hypothetical protein